jgi:anaerobic magnesium-protoporphyrin IX monomethyl ester cyclase
MRVILADLRASEGLVAKDTVAGGYGSRFVPFSRVTRVYCYFKRNRLDLPSIQMGYLAAILSRRGHEVVFTREARPDGDVALVLSSLVDYRRETQWADDARRHGIRVGFVGLASSKMPELFRDHADFLILGEPESAAYRLAAGEQLKGLVPSPPVPDLNSLPFPNWELLRKPVGKWRRTRRLRFPVLASRGCTEFCTYCPHRILAGYRSRSVSNVVDELEELSRRYRNPHIVFRDPLFTQDRERCISLCEEILARGLSLTFDCETRLDALDNELLELLRRTGLRAVTFGVETIDGKTLRRVGRRPIPEPHQREIIHACHQLGITTVAYYVFGFLPDDWSTISATIEYSITLGTTFAQFKLLTPYPGTPMWKQFSPMVYEKDWQEFNGYTPTFHHPNLTSQDLRFLLGAAYARFYARPGWLLNYCNLREFFSHALLHRMDRKVLQWHAENEISLVSRAAEC